MSARPSSPRRVLAIAVCAAALFPSAAAAGHTAQARAAPSATVDVRYGPRPAERLDVHLPPAGRHPRAAVLLVHGGGWWAGGKSRLTPIARALAARGFVVFNADYTLATRERPGFPRQLGELRAALAWIEANAARYGADPRRLGVLGTSAGGNLAALLATTARPGRLRALVTWSAPFDLTALPGQLRGLAAVFTGCWLRCRPRTLASPLFHVTPSAPPALIVNSRRELVPARQALRMARALSAAHVLHELLLVPGTLHGRELEPYAFAPTIAFLRARL